MSLLVESPSLSITTAPLVSTALPDETYIFALASLPSFYAASASTPSNAIHLLDKTTLHNVRTLPGHDISTSALRTANCFANTSNPTLLSCGKDATVKAWDERSGSVAVKLSVSRKPRGLLSFDVSPDGLTVAAGTELQGDDALILYWDPRNPAAPLRTHGSTHSDDITALHYLATESSSSSDKTILSASSDGLISTSNANEDDEDEAVLHVGNWGCSISQAGWFTSQQGLQIWAQSDMETFSTWSNECDLSYDIDIRTPSVYNSHRPWVTDYVVTCNGRNQSSDQSLQVFVGSNEGDVALITKPDSSDASAAWSLQSLWTSSHSGIVRSLLWNEKDNVIVTGGEDSRLNVWPNCSRDAIIPEPSGSGNNDAMDVDQPALRKRERDDDAETRKRMKRI